MLGVIVMLYAVTTENDGPGECLNFVHERDGVFVHRQIERRDGRIFMRMKRRSLRV